LSLGYFSALSVLIPLIAAGFTLRRQNGTLKKLSVFIVLTACTEASAIICSSHGINNMPISHIFTFFQVAIFAWIFSGILKGLGAKIVVILLITFTTFSILNLVLWESVFEFNSNQRYFAAIVLIMYCIGYFMHIFVKTHIERIELDPYFWMCASVLLYTTGTLFLFIFAEEILKGKNNTYWDLNCVLNIILNTGLTLTLWLGTRKSQ